MFCLKGRSSFLCPAVVFPLSGAIHRLPLNSQVLPLTSYARALKADMLLMPLSSSPPLQLKMVY